MYESPCALGARHGRVARARHALRSLSSLGGEGHLGHIFDALTAGTVTPPATGFAAELLYRGMDDALIRKM